MTAKKRLWADEEISKWRSQTNSQTAYVGMTTRAGGAQVESQTETEASVRVPTQRIEVKGADQATRQFSQTAILKLQKFDAGLSAEALAKTSWKVDSIVWE